MSMDQIADFEPLHEKGGDVKLGEAIDEAGDPPRVWSKYGPSCSPSFLCSLPPFFPPPPPTLTIKSPRRARHSDTHISLLPGKEKTDPSPTPPLSPSLPPSLPPSGEYPGTAFTRSLGDSIAEELGVYAVPEITVRKVSSKDKYVVVASDGKEGGREGGREG